LYLSPSFAPNDTDTIFEIKSTPVIPSSGLIKVLNNTKILATLNPNIPIVEIQKNQFQLTKQAKMNITSFYPSIDGLEWQIAFQIKSLTTGNEIFKIENPLSLFGSFF
jgi:hypothetical protein